MQLQDMYLKEFIEATASKAPVPGGGSVSALCAALSASLCQMVAGLTIGKKGYEQQTEQMTATFAHCQAQIPQLLNAIDEDSKSFDGVMVAMRLPKATEEEKATRRQAIIDATKQAAEVPLRLAQNADKLFEICEYVVTYGNKNAMSDVCVATMLLRTAVLGALYNVKINLAGLPQDEFYITTTEQVSALEARAKIAEQRILAMANL